MCKEYKVQCSRCLGFFYEEFPTLDIVEYVCDYCYYGDFEIDYEDYERGFIS